MGKLKRNNEKKGAIGKKMTMQIRGQNWKSWKRRRNEKVVKISN
jgi:hypothetical protein